MAGCNDSSMHAGAFHKQTHNFVSKRKLNLVRSHKQDAERPRITS